jgi:uncharacterized protein YbjT (DUF2867 family)
MSLKVIVTGATGMVGEGVLMECLQNSKITEVLAVGRKVSGMQHPKLKELVVNDFMQIDNFKESLSGYDACFYCAGISSVGLSEETYTHITYTTTMHFAEVLQRANPQLVFNFVSGGHTDSSEKGKVMWARVKGKTENALLKLFPGRQYNFRPALMKPTKGQKNFKGYNKSVKVVFPLLKLFFPSCTLQEIALAMINAAVKGYSKFTLEVADIKELAKA